MGQETIFFAVGVKNLKTTLSFNYLGHYISFFPMSTQKEHTTSVYEDGELTVHPPKKKTPKKSTPKNPLDYAGPSTPTPAPSSTKKTPKKQEKIVADEESEDAAKKEEEFDELNRTPSDEEEPQGEEDNEEEKESEKEDEEEEEETVASDEESPHAGEEEEADLQAAIEDSLVLSKTKGKAPVAQNRNPAKEALANKKEAVSISRLVKDGSQAGEKTAKKSKSTAAPPVIGKVGLANAAIKVSTEKKSQLGTKSVVIKKLTETAIKAKPKSYKAPAKFDTFAEVRSQFNVRLNSQWEEFVKALEKRSDLKVNRRLEHIYPAESPEKEKKKAADSDAEEEEESGEEEEQQPEPEDKKVEKKPEEKPKEQGSEDKKKKANPTSSKTKKPDGEKAKTTGVKRQRPDEDAEVDQPKKKKLDPMAELEEVVEPKDKREKKASKKEKKEKKKKQEKEAKRAEKAAKKAETAGSSGKKEHKGGDS